MYTGSLFGIKASNLFRDNTNARLLRSDKLYDTAQVLGPIKTKFGKHNTGFTHEKELDKPRDLEHKIEEELADNISTVALQYAGAATKEDFNKMVAKSIVNAYGKDRYEKVKKQVDAQMIERFNKWLLGQGEESEYYDPTNTKGKSWFIKNPDPKAKYSSKLGVMSAHNSVQRYMKDLVNPHIEHLQELGKRILMQGSTKTGRQPTLKELFDYYKYVVRGIDPKRDILAAYLDGPGIDKGGLGAEPNTVADMHVLEIRQTNELLKQLIKETTGLSDRLTLREESGEAPEPIFADVPPPEQVVPEIRQDLSRVLEELVPYLEPPKSTIIPQGNTHIETKVNTIPSTTVSSTIIPGRRDFLEVTPPVVKPPEAVIFAKPAPPPVDTSAAVLRQYARQKAAAIPTNIFPPAAPTPAEVKQIPLPPDEEEATSLEKFGNFVKRYNILAATELKAVEYNGRDRPSVSVYSHVYNDDGIERNVIRIDHDSSLSEEEAKHHVYDALVRLQHYYNDPKWGTEGYPDTRSDNNPIYSQLKLIGHVKYNPATKKYEVISAYELPGAIEQTAVTNVVDTDTPMPEAKPAATPKQPEPQSAEVEEVAKKLIKKYKRQSSEKERQAKALLEAKEQEKIALLGEQNRQLTEQHHAILTAKEQEKENEKQALIQHIQQEKESEKQALIQHIQQLEREKQEANQALVVHQEQFSQQHHAILTAKEQEKENEKQALIQHIQHLEREKQEANQALVVHQQANQQTQQQARAALEEKEARSVKTKLKASEEIQSLRGQYKNLAEQANNELYKKDLEKAELQKEIERLRAENAQALVLFQQAQQSVSQELVPYSGQPTAPLPEREVEMAGVPTPTAVPPVAKPSPVAKPAAPSPAVSKPSPVVAKPAAPLAPALSKPSSVNYVQTEATEEFDPNSDPGNEEEEDIPDIDVSAGDKKELNFLKEKILEDEEFKKHQRQIGEPDVEPARKFIRTEKTARGEYGIGYREALETGQEDPRLYAQSHILGLSKAIPAGVKYNLMGADPKKLYNIIRGYKDQLHIVGDGMKTLKKILLDNPEQYLENYNPEATGQQGELAPPPKRHSFK